MNYSNNCSTRIFVIKLLTFLNVKIPWDVIQKGCKLIENTSQKYKLNLYLIYQHKDFDELNGCTMLGFYLTEA